MRNQPLLGLFCTLLALTSGCIDLQLALQEVLDGHFGGRPPTNGDEEPDDPAQGDVPVVRLGLSNSSPQVNEEVRLTCSVVGGDAGAVLFGFQPANGRLFINRVSGTASYIVEETDIAVAFAFTCTATNEAGTSRPSNEQVIIATP